MRVNVKVFGTLCRQFQSYEPADGLTVEIPDGARVDDLIDHLELSGLKGYAVAIGGRIVKSADILEEGMTIHLLQAAAGG
jgi:sulfur carrier protein ThiS